MDPKASAKAKRSYSQQGRKKHPSPALIAQKKKAAQAGSEGIVQQAHSHALPSNWERYDNGENEAGSFPGTMLEEEIKPKNKGTDFAYLIEQAQSSHHELRRTTMPELPSFFDELTTDFMKGMSSINTLRRKDLLFRCEDDHFLVDNDGLTSSYEVPFLNLNLHALAAQLSEIELSKRLFIEEDLLPNDLHSDESKVNISSFQSELLGAINAEHNLEPSDYCLHFPPANLEIQHEVGGSSGNISSSSTLKVVEEADTLLDMLFESFKETSISGSDHAHLLDVKSNESPWKEGHLFGSIYETVSNSRALNSKQSGDKGQAPTMIVMKTSIDDSIDELLAESSSVWKEQKHLKTPDADHLLADAFTSMGGQKVRGTLNDEKLYDGHSSSLGSKVMDDFDSWMDSF